MDPGPVHSYLDADGKYNKGGLTRSSPIGPAEHDEGGSLVAKAGQTKSSVWRSLIEEVDPPLLGGTSTPRQPS